MIRSGDLNTYVTFQESVTIEGDYGTTEEWQDFVSCWGKLKSLMGRTYFEAKQANSEVEGTLEIRYRTDLKEDMRVNIDGQIYDIEAMYDPDQRKEELHVLLKGQTS